DRSLHRVEPQNFDRYDVQRAKVRRGQPHVRRTAFLVRLQEPSGTEAPVLAGPDPGKPECGPRGGEGVADVFRIGEEFGGHHGADRVAAAVLGAGVAVPVAEKPRKRRRGTGFERAAEDIDSVVSGRIGHACGTSDGLSLPHGTADRSRKMQKITRWTAPCSTVVRPVPSVSPPTNRVRSRRIMSSGEMPRTSGSSRRSDAMETMGIVRPMLAIAEPSARFMLF